MFSTAAAVETDYGVVCVRDVSCQPPTKQRFLKARGFEHVHVTTRELAWSLAGALMCRSTARIARHTHRPRGVLALPTSILTVEQNQSYIVGVSNVGYDGWSSNPRRLRCATRDPCVFARYALANCLFFALQQMFGMLWCFGRAMEHASRRSSK